MWTGSIVAIALVALLVVLIVRLLDRTPSPPASAPSARPGPDEILAARFARGEIDDAEYHRRLDALRG